MAVGGVVLRLLITAVDGASSVIRGVFSFLDKTTSASANFVREKLSNLFGDGLGSAIAFEAALARVQAKSNATAPELAKLREAAIAQSQAMRLGANGSVLAAQALEELTGAGLGVKEAIGALPATLRIAKNEQIETAESARALTDTMSIMGLAFDQASRVGDVLQKSADETSTSVSALAEAIRTGGGEAVKAGYSFEQTVVILTAFAKAGIQGSEAGTALKSLLQDIGDPASKARQELAKFGTSTGDVTKFIGRLIELGPQSLQVVRAFSDEAGPGLAALLRVGTKGLEAYRQAIEKDAVGGLEKASNTINTTTRGALDRLAGAWEQVKTRLAEPLLQPIAAGAELLAKRLSELQSSGVLEKITGSIVQLFTDAANDADGFIRRIDWDNLKGQAEKAVAAIRTAMDDTISAIQGKVQTVSDWTTTIFSPLTQAIDGYRLAWALANEDQAKAAQIQAQIEARTAAIGRALSGASSEYNKASNAANAYGESSKGAASSTEDLQKAAQASAEKIAALNTAIAAQQAEVDRLAEANAKGQASNEQYGAAVQALWALQDQLRDAQAAQKTAQDALNPSIANAVELQKLHAVELGKIETSTTQASSASRRYRDALAEIDQQILVASNNAGGWREGLKLTGVQMFGLKEAADALAKKLVLIEQAQRDGIATDSEVAAAKFKANAAQDLYNKALESFIAQQERAVAAVQRANELDEKGHDLKIKQKQAEAELAAIKGDVVAASRAQADQAQLEIEKADALVAGKQKEIAAYQDNIAAVRLKLAADGELNDADQDQLAVMADKLAALKLEQEDLASAANAIREKTEAERVAAAAARQASEEQAKAAAAARQASEEQAKAAAAAKEHAEQLKAAGEAASAALSGWAQRLGELSPAAREAFDGFNAEAEKTRDTAQEIADALAGLASGGYVRWANEVAIKALQIEQAFRDQAGAADELVARLDTATESGGRAAGELNGLVAQAESARQNMNLLDQSRLDALQAAIDRANDRIREMQDLTRDAKDQLAALNAEIAAERGDTATADRLKLELDHARALADAEQKILDAQAAGNAELVGLYEEQKRKLEELYNLKEKNLEADIRQRQNQNAATTTGGQTAANTPSGNGAGGATTVNNTFLLDPTKLADEEWVRRNVLPTLDKIARLRG